MCQRANKWVPEDRKGQGTWERMPDIIIVGFWPVLACRAEKAPGLSYSPSHPSSSPTFPQSSLRPPYSNLRPTLAAASSSAGS